MKALFSALTSTVDKDMISSRGHLFDSEKNLPLVIEDGFEDIKKTKDVENILLLLGLEKELTRIKNKKIRPGKGTKRGRKYKKTRGPLIIVSKEGDLLKSAKNIAGVDISIVENLKVESLAPGTHPGRLCIWTKSALEKIEKLAG